MNMRIESVQEHKDFFLKEPFEWQSDLLFLTGKNGVGKSRLFKSLSMGEAVAMKDGEVVSPGNIRFISQEELVPRIETSYSKEDVIKRRDTLLKIFKSNSGMFDYEFDQTKRMTIVTESMSFDEISAIVRAIGKKLEKRPSTLSEGELITHFDGVGGDIFGPKNIFGIFNSYLAEREDNDHREWLISVKNREGVIPPVNDFEKVFGEKPWELLSSLVNKVLDGKVLVKNPEQSSSHEFKYIFYSSETESAVGMEDWSSGEKTLLWLALVLFMSQYSRAVCRAPALLLIDEPDAFLHPSMVARLIELLEEFSKRFSTKIILITHSPTTVALAPEGAVCVLEDGMINKVGRDLAISELLYGVSQISVSPDNRRQVYVESFYDAQIYQDVLIALTRKAGFINQAISLEFIPAGAKIPKNHIRDTFRSVFGDVDEEQLDLYVEKVNGVGNCVQVIAQVEHLVGAGNKTVRGLIDRDSNGSRSGIPVEVIVLGGGACYAIENVALDPVSVVYQLTVQDGKRFSLENVCGADVNWRGWIGNTDLLQESTDWFIEKVVGAKNNRDFRVEYVGGASVLSDLRYMNAQGHELLDTILRKFGCLNRLARKEEIPREIVRRGMIDHFSGEFIPMLFVESLSSLQK